MSKKVRIGIDVGGTFTHAVAVAIDSLDIIASAKVPTTHIDKIGVAKGIINALEELLKAGILKENILRIAHSTTQATNALLEGDLAPVAVLAIGKGVEGLRVASQSNLKKLKLFPGKSLNILHDYVEAIEDEGLLKEQIKTKLKKLQSLGALSIVAVSAFSVDDPLLEAKILDCAKELNITATATHQITLLYGLKIRLKTAIINAAIMPKMINTANMTEKAIRELGINAPIVVMRSDGGAMDIDQMRKKPILTILSGPSAGVSAALIFGKIANGIFLEVGGTSTDISFIKDGRADYKTAQIGDHRLYLNTIDIKTIGIAGGSMPCFSGKKIKQVGPRSAHLAGFTYSSFYPYNLQNNQEKVFFNKVKDDLYQYLAFKQKENLITITTTCCANLLGLIPKNDYAFGNLENIKIAFQKTVSFLDYKSTISLAEKIMSLASKGLFKIIKQISKEKSLKNPVLIGGGGGASVWLNYLEQKTGFKTQLIEHAPVISAIGAAVALLQETVERNLIEPRVEDIVEIRSIAEKNLIKAGADLETIEIKIEIDKQKGVLRAIANGSLSDSKSNDLILDQDYFQTIFKNNFGVEAKIDIIKTTGFFILTAIIIKNKFFSKQKSKVYLVLDKKGTARIKAEDSLIIKTVKQELIVEIEKMFKDFCIYSDAGCEIPSLFLISQYKMIDLTGLINQEQVKELALKETQNFNLNQEIFILCRIK